MGVQVVNRISDVFEDLAQEMHRAQPDLKHIVYSPTLDFVAIIHHLRRKLKVEQELKNEVVVSGASPLVAFNRNFLTISEILNERSRFLARSNLADANNKYKIYKAVYGSVLMRYLYITNNITELENFEQPFACNDSFRKILNFESNVGNEGDFEYQVYWDNLSDLFVSEIEDGSVKYSVSGMAKIIGWWVIYSGEDTGKIQTINVDIQYPKDNSLHNFSIT
jgi:hypothetical protein